MSAVDEKHPDLFPTSVQDREAISRECVLLGVSLMHIAEAIECVSELYRQPDVDLNTPFSLLHRTIETLTIILEQQPLTWRC